MIPYLVFTLIAVLLNLVIHGIVDGYKGIFEVLANTPLYMKREGTVSYNSLLWFLLTFYLGQRLETFSAHDGLLGLVADDRGYLHQGPLTRNVFT